MLQKINYKNPGNALPLNIHELNKRFDTVCVFDPNKKANSTKHIRTAKLVALGATQEIIIKNDLDALSQLQSFYDAHKGWMFGYLSYDIKNEIEDLASENHDGLAFPLLHFFVPEYVLEIGEEEILLYYNDETSTASGIEKIFNCAFSSNKKKEASSSNIHIRARISKPEYITAVQKLQQHILRGDIYEVNFCQEFYSEDAVIDPVNVYEKLNSISEAPFAAFCKFSGRYLLSSSPERFLKKTGNTLISQPIKGTIRRSENEAEDLALKEKLRNDPKEQNENVMIVDLVRNDLSRIAAKGSVHVDELFGIYSFKQVHQMISTVSCEAASGAS